MSAGNLHTGGRAIADIRIIKRTELDNVVVMTGKRTKPTTLIRPFFTFTVTPKSRYAQRLTDYTCEATALHQHAALVRDLTANQKDEYQC